jgi:hypothetical protein
VRHRIFRTLGPAGPSDDVLDFRDLAQDVLDAVIQAIDLCSRSARCSSGTCMTCPRGGGLSPGIGATAAVSLLPAALAPRYEGRTAPSVGVFFSLRAARHQM